MYVAVAMNHTQAITPAGPAPAGVSSNFIDPTNYAGSLVACNVVLLVVSILIVAARMVSRTMMTDWRLGWDGMFLYSFASFRKRKAHANDWQCNI